LWQGVGAATDAGEDGRGVCGATETLASSIAAVNQSWPDSSLTDQPLDLGNSVLRSVSPIHVQYLQNMGVTGSLVTSLIHRGKLWGLISGNGYSGTAARDT
jgi:hypothetical protein